MVDCFGVEHDPGGFRWRRAHRLAHATQKARNVTGDITSTTSQPVVTPAIATSTRSIAARARHAAGRYWTGPVRKSGNGVVDRMVAVPAHVRAPNVLLRTSQR